jgi:NACalpha-BTF3-like transcription factor
MAIEACKCAVMLGEALLMKLVHSPAADGMGWPMEHVQSTQPILIKEKDGQPIVVNEASADFIGFAAKKRIFKDKGLATKEPSRVGQVGHRNFTSRILRQSGE